MECQPRVLNAPHMTHLCFFCSKPRCFFGGVKNPSRSPKVVKVFQEPFIQAADDLEDDIVEAIPGRRT